MWGNMDSIYPNLCTELSKAGICMAEVAEVLNTTETVINDKLRGIEPWLLHEAVTMCRLLNTSDVKFLFLRLV